MTTSDFKGYDYSILSDHFPESVIEEFKASAIHPHLCLLNAEFLTGDKAIAELLPNAPDTHLNNGSLKKGYRDRYAPIIKDGGTSYTGIDIGNHCIAECTSFKAITPRKDKDGKDIKYDNPVKKPATAFLPVIDGEIWQAISKWVGVDIPDEVEADRHWESEKIGSDEWIEWCQALSIKFLDWIIANSKIRLTPTEGAKKALSGTSTGEICISLPGVWNGCPEKTKGAKDYALIEDLKLIATPGREIVIAFDKDDKEMTVNIVRVATIRLGDLLEAEGCNVSIAKWESIQGKGIDDFIVKAGAKEFHRIIRDALPLAELKVIKKNNPSKTEKPLINIFSTSWDGGLQVLVSKESETEKEVHQPVGNHIEAIAYVENTDNAGTGILLKFRTQRGKTQQLTIPRTMLTGDGQEAIRLLTDRGYHHIRQQKNLLLDYLFGLGGEIDQVYTIADKTGWVDGSFLTLAKTYGNPNLRFREPEPDNTLTEIKGTLAGWKSEVAAKCTGNSRLIFSLGTVFAAALLEPAQIESGGFHLVGTTSIGKTTTLKVAASVAGLENIPNWRSTSNALEGKAAEFNHLLLPLDEIAQADPQTVGASAYMLGNGQGKGRMAKNLINTKLKTWELLFLSTGEVSMTDYLKQAKIPAKGGMEARMPSIPADAGKGNGYGVLENIQAYDTPKSFVDALESSIRKQQGTALDEYLTHLVEVRKVDGFDVELRERVHSIARLISQQFSDTAIGRVAVRFALVQVGLEQAHRFGLLPFPIEQCQWAVGRMFDAWVNYRGGDGSIEIKEACNRIELLLVTNQYSDRICHIAVNSLKQNTLSNDRPVRDLLAYKSADGEEFWVTSSTFNALFADGVDKSQLVKELQDRKWLKLGRDKKHPMRERTLDLKTSEYFIFVPFWRSKKTVEGVEEVEELTNDKGFTHLPPVEEAWKNVEEDTSILSSSSTPSTHLPRVEEDRNSLNDSVLPPLPHLPREKHVSQPQAESKEYFDKTSNEWVEAEELTEVSEDDF